MNKYHIISGILVLIVTVLAAGYIVAQMLDTPVAQEPISRVKKILPSPQPTATPAVSFKTPPATYVIPSASHVGQTFNNCGPASLSMIMSYFGKNVTQDELREQMRPFNNPAGGVDDKSVFASEFVVHAKKYGLESIALPNGYG